MGDEEFDPVPGAVETLEPGLRRVLAPNPSPMTFRGTNTYILGEGEVAVIDPGPADESHYAALMGALEPKESIAAILVTHSHLDHSELARPLAEAAGAPVLAFGDSGAGRSAVMERLAREGLAGGGEGVDPDFAPDERIGDGDMIDCGVGSVAAVATPGHFGNHLSYAWSGALFTGDHIMGWASSLVSPPDGDLGAFMTSCERIAARGDRVAYPGHGAPVLRPQERALELLKHRAERADQIREALGPEPRTVAEVAAEVYRDVDSVLLPAAERNAFAHLIDLVERKQAVAEPRLACDARFSAI